jgi:3-methylfumaryl-CoA hydratase
MNDAPNLDVGLLRSWIGRTELARDVVTLRLARELHATLDSGGRIPEEGEAAPLAVHWCLAPTAAATATLGPDGHPPRGGFLPPVPLPRRMWVASHVRFHDRLRIGDTVERRSRIANVEAKQGRTGTLCFVTLNHEIGTARGPAVSDESTIVYYAGARDALAERTPPASRPASLPGDRRWQKMMVATPVLLFRYSALTFNGHRIHYDRDYAVKDEGYAGLVVHGPLQATWLLDHAAAIWQSAPATFTFTAKRPLFDGAPFRLGTTETDAGLTLWIENGEGWRTCEAEARR